MVKKKNSNTCSRSETVTILFLLRLCVIYCFINTREESQKHVWVHRTIPAPPPPTKTCHLQTRGNKTRISADGSIGSWCSFAPHLWSKWTYSCKFDNEEVILTLNMDGLVWIKITQLMSLLKRHHSPERHLTAAVWQWWGETSSSQFVPASSQSCTGGGRGEGGGGPSRSLHPGRKQLPSRSPSQSFHLLFPCMATVFFLSHSSPLLCFSSSLGCVGCFARRALPGCSAAPRGGRERSEAGWTEKIHQQFRVFLTELMDDSRPPHTWMSPQRGGKYY